MSPEEMYRTAPKIQKIADQLRVAALTARNLLKDTGTVAERAEASWIGPILAMCGETNSAASATEWDLRWGNAEAETRAEWERAFSV